MSRRHRRSLSQEEKDEIVDRQTFSLAARKREQRYKIADRKFIAEYRELCLKHNRYIGSLSMDRTIYHEKDKKKINWRFDNINFNWAANGRPRDEFHVYNRRTDSYPDKGSGFR